MHEVPGTAATTEHGTAEETAAPDAAPVPSPVTPRWFWPALGGVLVVALVVRLLFVLLVKSHSTLWGDAYWYHYQARLVADGQGFLNPVKYFLFGGARVPAADHPPAFILLLAAADRVGISSLQAQRAMMCVLGTGTVGVLALLVRRIASCRAALIVAVLAALYPNIWINDGMLLSETLYALALAVALLFAYRVWQGGRLADVALLSVGLTVAALTRPESVLLFPLLVLPLVLARRALPWRERLRRLAVAAVIPIVAFAPWIGYNLARFEQPVYLSSGGGQTLLAANCDSTYSGRYLGYYDLACFESAQPAPGADPSQAAAFYRERALTYIKHHLSEQPRVIAARVGRLWNVFRPQQNVLYNWSIEGRGDRAQSQWALWGFYALVPFEIAGVVLLRRRGVPLYPLLLQFALATVAAAATFGVTRYRIGADVAAVVLAAVAVDALIGLRWRSPAGPRVASRGGPGLSSPARGDAGAPAWSPEPTTVAADELR